MKKIELVIDFGSESIKVYKKDAGLVLNEANMIVLENIDGKQVTRFAGNEALRAVMQGRAQGLQVVEPIKEGVVVQERACILMLKNFLSRIYSGKFFKPVISAYALVSSGLINIEKTNIEEVCIKAGVSEVVIVESPIAMHMATNEKHSFIVDIGAEKTEIAIVNETGIITGCSINIGGASINQAITDYLCDRYKLRVPKSIVEEIKLNVCSFIDNDVSSIVVNGRSIVDSEPLEVKLTAAELRAVATPVIDKIIEVIESVTLMIPDNIAESISKRGFFLGGGTAEIAGIDTYLEKKLYFKCNKLESPSTAAVTSASKFFYDKTHLSEMLNIPNIQDKH